MAILDSALYRLTSSTSWIEVLIAIVLVVAARCVYMIFLHPLSHIPGPPIAKCSYLWLYYHSFVGDQCSVIQRLHKRYGPMLRVGPNEVQIAKGEALGPIYMENGGFEKSSFYKNFDIDGHASIFSTLSLAARAPRAKAVLPVFSAAAVREATPIIISTAEAMIERMKNEAQTGKPINVLNLTRSYALDAVSTYVFQRPYGAIEEKSVQLSASPHIDLIVTVGKYFYLPASWLVLLEWLLDLFARDRSTKQSVEVVNSFVGDMVKGTKEGGSSYPSRLLSSGATRHETAAQCNDVIFAGTDSTGNNLAFICWSLVAKPEIYSRLRKEIEANVAVKADLQTLPYLSGVVKEALRLSMAIPCRLPRVVPKEGWYFEGCYLPKGTNVGVSAFELHLDPKTFPQPNEFLPNRWLEASTEMHRDWLPFGKGARGCIARYLALTELFVATERIVASDVLSGAKTVAERIEIYEWFNSKVRGDKIELVWPNNA